ncbi:hypothetical protein WMY93_034001 [Mugilogobius chulae]|uniref:Uncharacterized protein n=1 Tax=Mugilogobius chulae TaxID=88201 RepID=A0AAW0MIH6_9GOBI
MGPPRSKKRRPSFRKLLKTSGVKLENKQKNRNFKKQNTEKKQRKEQKRLRKALKSATNSTPKELHVYANAQVRAPPTARQRNCTKRPGKSASNSTPKELHVYAKRPGKSATNSTPKELHVFAKRPGKSASNSTPKELHVYAKRPGKSAPNSTPKELHQTPSPSVQCQAAANKTDTDSREPDAVRMSVCSESVVTAGGAVSVADEEEQEQFLEELPSDMLEEEDLLQMKVLAQRASFITRDLSSSRPTNDHHSTPSTTDTALSDLRSGSQHQKEKVGTSEKSGKNSSKNVQTEEKEVIHLLPIKDKRGVIQQSVERVIKREEEEEPEEEEEEPQQEQEVADQSEADLSPEHRELRLTQKKQQIAALPRP